MTIKDLYLIAINNGTEDYEIELQYQDGGGFYQGSTSLTELEYNYDDKTVTLI